uniref:Uncharacterized protein n=1 Tax=Oryza meridionalis TaxID=40149 RepID=A0A0E0CP38_9ORYZ
MQDTGAGRSRRRRSGSVRVGTATRGPRPHPCAGRGEAATLPAAARHDGGTPDEGGDPAATVEAVTNMLGGGEDGDEATEEGRGKGGGGEADEARIGMRAAAAAVPVGGGGSGGHGVRAAPSCSLANVLLVEADSFPFAGGGRWRSGRTFCWWRTSPSPCWWRTTAQRRFAEAVAGVGGSGDGGRDCGGGGDVGGGEGWRSVTLSGGWSGVSLFLGLCVGDVGVWVAV